MEVYILEKLMNELRNGDIRFLLVLVAVLAAWVLHDAIKTKREPFTFYVDPDLSPDEAMSYFPPWDEDDDDAQTDRSGPENTGN